MPELSDDQVRDREPVVTGRLAGDPLLRFLVSHSALRGQPLELYVDRRVDHQDEVEPSA